MNQILLSLQRLYESKFLEADFQIKLFTTKALAVAGHSNHQDDLDKWIQIKSDNESKLRQVLVYMPKPEKEVKKDGK